jgi:hypothetical protein
LTAKANIVTGTAGLRRFLGVLSFPDKEQNVLIYTHHTVSALTAAASGWGRGVAEGFPDVSGGAFFSTVFDKTSGNPNLIRTEYKGIAGVAMDTLQATEGVFEGRYIGYLYGGKNQDTDDVYDYLFYTTDWGGKWHLIKKGVGVGPLRNSFMVSKTGGLLIAGGIDETDTGSNAIHEITIDSTTMEYTSDAVIASDITGLGIANAEILGFTTNGTVYYALIRIVADDAFIILQSDDAIDWITYNDGTYDIVAVNQGTKQFRVTGNQVSRFFDPGRLWIYESTGNDDSGNADKGYTITGVTYDTINTQTVITVAESISSAVVDGTIYHYPLVDVISATSFDREWPPAFLTNGTDLFIVGGSPLKVYVSKSSFTGDSMTVKEIIERESLRVGLSASEIDADEEEEDSIPGYSIDSLQSLKSSLLPLQKGFQFDVVTYDKKVNFIKDKNRTPIAIDTNDLDAHPDGQEIGNLVEVHLEDRTGKVPKRVEVSYYDFDLNYEEAIQTDYRNDVPHHVVKQINLPLFLQAQQAQKIATALLWGAETEAKRYSIQLPIMKYIKMVAGDRLSFSLSGVDYDLKATQLSCDWETMVMIVQATGYNVEIYEHSTVPPEWAEIAQVKRPLSGIMLLDCPITSPVDDDFGFYALAAPIRSDEPNWTGVHLYVRPAFDSRWIFMGSITKKGSFGQALTVLQAPVVPYLKDTVNTVDIGMMGGDLLSVSDDEFDKGRNTAIVGGEIIRFQNATDLGNRVYRLSGLIRGLFGTEEYVHTHRQEDMFVLLDTVKRIDTSINHVGQLLEYRYITIGTTEERVLRFQNDAVGKKPLSPVSITAVKYAHDVGTAPKGTWHIEWMSRSRGITSWITELNPPLSDGLEQFIIQFLDDDDEVLLEHTVTVLKRSFDRKPHFDFKLVTESYTDIYGETQNIYGQDQVYGGEANQIRIRICQVSEGLSKVQEELGRGTFSPIQVFTA